MAGIAFKLPSWFKRRPEEYTKQDFEELANIINHLSAGAADAGITDVGQINPEWEKIVSGIPDGEITEALIVSFCNLDNLIRPILLAWNTFNMIVAGGQEERPGEREAVKGRFARCATALLCMAAVEAAKIANVELSQADDSADDYGQLEEYGE